MLFDVSTARLYGLLSRLLAKPVVCVTPATVLPVAFQLERNAVVVDAVALVLETVVVVVVDINQNVTTSARPSPQNRAPRRKPPTTINHPGQSRISSLQKKQRAIEIGPKGFFYVFFLI